MAASPREAATGADLVVAMVADDAASRAVWEGETGALAGLKAGAIAMESSTLTPEWIRALAAAVAAKGAGFLDGPVGGSKPQAAEGKLILFIGGDAAVVDKARPALEAISARINHVGGTGTGATWKLINNVMGAAHLAILSEGLALARKAGIDMALAAEMIGVGPTASGMVLARLERVTSGRYDDPDFSLKLMAKDTRYATELARSVGAPLHLFPVVAEVYRHAEAHGLGDFDTAAVAEWFKSQGG